MSKIVAVHSWRGGTGKSTLVARLGRLLAARGFRVGLVDAGLQAPGLHEALGVDAGMFRLCLWDYLSGACEIEEALLDLTGSVQPGTGRLFLVPARTEVEAVTLSVSSGRYDAGLLYEGFHRLVSVLDLDLLFVDTHSGANHEAMHAIASSDIDLLVTRAGSSENRSATLATRIAAQLGCQPPEALLVVNMAPTVSDPAVLRRRAEQAYRMPAAAILPRIADDPQPGETGPAQEAFDSGVVQLAERILASGDAGSVRAG